AALSGSPVHAVKFAFVCAELLSIGEAVLNPLIAPAQSRLNGVAKALLIGMPLGFQLTGCRNRRAGAPHPRAGWPALRLSSR
ncbi:hypothetical protein AAHH80_36300, partial [Burkholderia pseudomallei]